ERAQGEPKGPRIEGVGGGTAHAVRQAPLEQGEVEHQQEKRDREPLQADEERGLHENRLGCVRRCRQGAADDGARGSADAETTRLRPACLAAQSARSATAISASSSAPSD